MAIRLGINGAAGRMGQRLVALSSADKAFKLAAALESTGHPRIGEDAGTVAGVGHLGVPLAATLGGPVDVMVDFSVPQATESIVALCLEKRVPLVVATTGLEAEQREKIKAASGTIPL